MVVALKTANQQLNFLIVKSLLRLIASKVCIRVRMHIGYFPVACNNTLRQ